VNTIAELSLEQRRAFVTALLFIATIDDNYDPAEQAFVRAACQTAQLSPDDEAAINQVLLSRPSLDDVLVSVKDGPIARLLVRELVSLAHADGTYVEAERAGVAMICQKLGLSTTWLAAVEAWVADGIAWQKRGMELLEA